MKKSVVRENSKKMAGTIFVLIFNILIFANGASCICVNVPNNDMLEYSCTSGRSSDLYAIPESAEKIRITNMSLPRITRETFSRFGETLWVLSCSHCEISQIDPDAFKELKNLQQLRLDNNHLRDVKSSWFEGMNSLTYLDLNYNKIEHIEDAVYHNIPSLIDFRISGNRLECLNVEAMAKLNLSKILLSKNPHFKCPNAVAKYLEVHGLSSARDPEWKNFKHDLINPAGIYEATTRDWRTLPVYDASTPFYHEKLIGHTTTEDYTYEDYEYETLTPDRVPFPTTESPVPINEQTTRESSVQNFYPTRAWPEESTSSYPTRGQPKISQIENTHYPKMNFEPPLEQSEIYDLPEMIFTSTDIPTGRETSQNNSPQIFPETFSPTGNDNIPINDNIAMSYPTGSGENSPEINDYPTTNRPSEDFYQSSRNSDDFSHPQILDKYQQVQEPEAVTVVTQTKETTDKPLPDCPKNSSANIEASIAMIVIGFFLLSLKIYEN